MQAPYIIDGPSITWDEVASSTPEQLGERISSLARAKAHAREQTRSWNGPFHAQGTCPADFQCPYYRPHEDDDLAFHYKLFHTPCDFCSSNPRFLHGLCEPCQHLRLRHLLLCGPPYSSIGLGSFAEIKQRENCALCSAIAQTISLELLVAGISPLKADTDIECAITSISLPRARQEAKFNISISAYDRATVHEHTLTHAPSLVGGMIQVRFIDVQPQSPIAIFPLPLVKQDRPDWTRVKRWLEDCRAHHHTCSRTRLTVLIGGDAWKIRLIDVQQRCISTVDRTSCRYITLSYVCGPLPSRKLQANKSNIRALEQPGALAEGTLAATIEDAITVCKNLGERYLWVDCLCILEDDPKDRARELSRMDITYSSAYLNIVAAAGGHANFGLPGIRRELPRSAAQRKFKLYDCEIVQVLPFLDKTVNSSPWYTRGWTYQERILATRCLFFTSSQVYFSCNEMVQHEDTTIGAYQPPETSVLRDPIGGPGLYMPDLIEEYMTVATEYAKRALTYQSDVLAAFTGITRAFDARYGDQLVSGLLRLAAESGSGGSSFPFGLPEQALDAALLWDTVGPFTPRVPETGPMVLPSWSWISHVGPIKYGFDKYPGALVSWSASGADDDKSRWHEVQTGDPWMDEGRSRDAAYNRDILRSFPKEMYEIDSQPLDQLDLSSDSVMELCAPGRLIFQAQSAEFQLRRCPMDPGDQEAGTHDPDSAHGREIILIVGDDDSTAGLMEMDSAWVLRNLVSPPQHQSHRDGENATGATAEDNRRYQFIGLSSGRFPFAYSWAQRVPERGSYVAANAVVNVMLIELSPSQREEKGPSLTRRLGIGKVFVEDWRKARPKYRYIVLE